jgi:uncharacterized protein
VAKIPTTIPQLDTALNGGLDENSLSCIWVKPGVDGTPFAYQIAAAAAKTRKVFYFTNAKSPTSVMEEMKSYGFPAKKINFVDAYSALVGAKTSSSLLVANPKNPQEMLNQVDIITKKIKNHLIIIDSFSNLVDLTEKEDTSFLEGLKKSKATVACMFTEWPYKPAFIKSVRDIVDTIIEVKSVQEKLFFRQYFGVTKTKTGKATAQAVPFRVEKPGGVKVFISKVLVTGPFNAGKTSFIHSCSEKAVSVDRLGTTIALDHGHINHKGFAVDLFGTPGQQRFDPILKLLGGEALGVIVVVSSTDPQGFPRAVEMMKKAKVAGLPIVVAANKANLRGALKPSQIKTKMGLKDVEIIPVEAKDLTKVQPGLPCQLKKDHIEKVLDTLFGKLMQRKEKTK